MLNNPLSTLLTLQQLYQRHRCDYLVYNTCSISMPPPKPENPLIVFAPGADVRNS